MDMDGGAPHHDKNVDVFGYGHSYADFYSYFDEQPSAERYAHAYLDRDC
jgi:hypothetical protein